MNHVGKLVVSAMFADQKPVFIDMSHTQKRQVLGNKTFERSLMLFVPQLAEYTEILVVETLGEISNNYRQYFLIQ